MADSFQQHRQDLAAEIGSDGIALIPGGVETIRNYDVSHEFRQDSDFFHLTGFTEPEAAAVIVPGHPDGDYHLFVRPRDREQEIWNGHRHGVDGAREHFQAVAHEVAELEKLLPQLAAGRSVLYHRSGSPAHDRMVEKLSEKARDYTTRTGLPMPLTVADVRPLLSEQRLRKAPSELESLRAACELTAMGHREAIRFARPDLFEYQVQAAMEYVWREGGSSRNGYPSIVASGPNACILHYVENDRRLEDGDLVLIDAACEVDYFSADVTRTFPANGKFTGPQMAIYEVVASAHRKAVHASRPGATLRELHDIATREVTTGLCELGLLPRDAEDSMAMHHYREYFMHGTSHWLGLDVHDAGSYRVEGKPRTLETGMCFTVEPGIYIDSEREEIELSLLEYDYYEWSDRILLEGPAARAELDEAKKEAGTVRHPVPQEFRGIGVRIEDDIYISPDGHENLTAQVPVDPVEIEALWEEASWLPRAGA
jgi:Xaa-Pro aminopeptidase